MVHHYLRFFVTKENLLKAKIFLYVFLSIILGNLSQRSFISLWGWEYILKDSISQFESLNDFFKYSYVQQNCTTYIQLLTIKFVLQNTFHSSVDTKLQISQKWYSILSIDSCLSYLMSFTKKNKIRIRYFTKPWSLKKKFLNIDTTCLILTKIE